jgi:hypothetical protein
MPYPTGTFPAVHPARPATAASIVLAAFAATFAFGGALAGMKAL